MNIPDHREINAAINRNGWRIDRGNAPRIEKDGYEIYLYRDGSGVELTVRDPETMDREIVIEKRCTDYRTPMFVGLLIYLLDNFELVVNNARD